MKKIQTPLIVKISISLVSLLFFLSLLEIGLRTTGILYNLNRNTLSHQEINSPSRVEFEKLTSAHSLDKYVILTIGDSYTYGGINPINETYPYFLEEKLRIQSPFKNPVVINGGICDYNSRQVTLRFNDMIKKHKPDMVVILTGASDQFNLTGYNLEERGVNTFFSNLRIFKMAQIIELNLKAKLNKDPFFDFFRSSLEISVEDYLEEKSRIDNLLTSKTFFDKAWYYFNQGQLSQALSNAQAGLNSHERPDESLIQMAYFYYMDFQQSQNSESLQHALKLYEKAYTDYPESIFALNHLVYFYYDLSEFYFASKQFNLSVKYLLKAIPLDPTDEKNYTLLVKAFNLQNQYDGTAIVKVLESMIARNPRIRERKDFNNYYVLFQNKKKWEEEINQGVLDNLNEIITLAKENQIEIVLQNYPYPYPDINEIIKKAAQTHQVSLVDNASRFATLTQEEGWDKYFMKDGHCTTNGYRVIAENVYNTIRKIPQTNQP